MEYRRIKILLDRYFAGESTLEEEEQLRRYFAGPKVDERLQPYASLFQWFVRAGAEELPPDSARKIMEGLPAKRIWLRRGGRMWILRAAAAVLLVAGMWWTYQYQGHTQTAEVDWSKYEITDERAALEITRGALFKASKALNQGAEAAAGQLDRMQEMGKFFE